MCGVSSCVRGLCSRLYLLSSNFSQVERCFAVVDLGRGNSCVGMIRAHMRSFRVGGESFLLFLCLYYYSRHLSVFPSLRV
jgi:hypothetical protein